MTLSDGSRVLLCCFLTIVKDTYGQMKPSNAVADVGGEAIFNCSSTTLIPHWFMSKDGSTANPLTIALNCVVDTTSLQNHYKTEQIGGTTSCNLIVFDVTMEQAGVYWCAEISSSNVLLTVIDKFPVTTYNDTGGVVVENEDVIITSTLHHNGSVAPAPTLRPYFYWTNSVGQNVSSSYDSTTENTAVSQITVTAGRQDITGYTCHVYLKLNATINPNYATNTPTVSNSVTTTPINVMYSPSIPNITRSYQIITIDGIACEVSNVTCTSSGNPSPVYEWFDTLENVSLIKSSNFDLAEINRNYTCVASNTIRNEMLSSITFHVPKNGSTTKTCRFPHRESTWINVTGSDNGTGDCSKGYDGLNFACNADTYPNASYQWTGADNSQVNSQVYKNITINGIYSCTAYFNQSTSNYTGSVMFTNGTSEENVTECCEVWELAVSGVVPFLIKNVIGLVVFIICINFIEDFSSIMLTRFHWLKQFKDCESKGGKEIALCILFVIGSVAFGLVVIPILITIAFCFENKGHDPNDYEMRKDKTTTNHEDHTYENDKDKNSDKQQSSGSKSKWPIIVVWCVVPVALCPIAFIVVYFVFCNQMRYQIV